MGEKKKPLTEKVKNFFIGLAFLIGIAFLYVLLMNLPPGSFAAQIVVGLVLVIVICIIILGVIGVILEYGPILLLPVYIIEWWREKRKEDIASARERELEDLLKELDKQPPLGANTKEDACVIQINVNGFRLPRMRCWRVPKDWRGTRYAFCWTTEGFNGNFLALKYLILENGKWILDRKLTFRRRKIAKARSKRWRDKYYG